MSAMTDDSLPDVLAALRNYQQADEDGVMALVSRQACDEAATVLATAEARIAQAEAWDVRKFFAAIPPDLDGLTHEDGWTLMRREAAEKLKADLAQYREALREVRGVIAGLVGQQAMADDFWEETANKIDRLLATKETT